MNALTVPAVDRYDTHVVTTPDGDLTVGEWSATAGADSSAAPTMDVLAIHGITANHHCWPYLVDRLPAARVVAPDLRGRAGSCDVTGPFGMRAHADDMARILDARGIDTAVVVGHSMGGYVSVVFADRYPDRVGALVLVDGGLPLTPLSDAPPAPEVVDAIAAAVTTPIAKRLAATFPTREDAIGFWRVHPAFADSWNDVVADYADYDLTSPGAAEIRSRVTELAMAADSRDLLVSPDVPDALRRLRHRTQWLVAPRGLLNETPPLYPDDVVETWRAAFGVLDVHRVPDVNHYTIVLSEQGADAVAAAVNRARLSGE